MIGTELVDALWVATSDYDRRNSRAVGEYHLGSLHSAALVLAEHPGLARAWGDVLTERTAQQPADPATVRVALALALDAMGVEGRHDRMAADLLTTLSATGCTVVRTAP